MSDSCWEDRSVQREVKKSHQEHMAEHLPWFESAKYRVYIYTAGMVPKALQQTRFVAAGLTWAEAASLVEARNERSKSREEIRFDWFRLASEEAHTLWEKKLQDPANAARTRQDFFRFLGGRFPYKVKPRYSYGLELESPNPPLFRSIKALKIALAVGEASEVQAAYQLAVEENGADMVAAWLTDEQQDRLKERAA